MSSFRGSSVIADSNLEGPLGVLAFPPPLPPFPPHPTLLDREIEIERVREGEREGWIQLKPKFCNRVIIDGQITS